jgi:hypothetical protein
MTDKETLDRLGLEQELWAYDEPHESGGNVHVTMTRKQAIAWMRRMHDNPYDPNDDHLLFEEWRVVNWAYREEK